MKRERLRVLILEHTTADAELSAYELTRAGYEVDAEIVSTREEFLARLDAGEFDVVLADYRLPSWTGMDAFTDLRARDPDTPFILVTGTLGEERAVEAVKLGISDYILKQNLPRLPLAVRRALSERRAGVEQARARDLIRKLTLAVEQSPASVIVTDTAGTIEYVNRRFTELTGYSSREALGQNPRLLRSDQTPPELFQQLWRALQQGRVWRGELQNRTKSGELRWHAVTISPVRDATGAVTHFLSTQEDVTDRKEAERELHDREERFRRAQEALVDSEALFRRLTEASFDAIVLSDEGVIVDANRGFAELCRTPLDRIIGRPITDFFAEESFETLWRGLSGSAEGSYHLQTRGPEAEQRFLEATSRIHVSGGRRHQLTALRDLTEKRTLESQFQQAQKMEAVGRLAGGVAHDFNNLLTVITSYTDLVLDDLAPDDLRREDLEQIRQAAQGAAALTRQLLAFSRQQVISPRRLDLDEGVRGAEKMLKRVIGEDIELVTRLGDKPTVKMDPGQLEQIIMNLAVNARDAMPSGGRLSIETGVMSLEAGRARELGLTAGRYALLTVSDSGVGMSESTRARLFEPFFTTKEPGKGTGLGLSTVYGIVKESGGFIAVTSTPARGATFRIHLPLLDEPADGWAQSGTDQVPRGTETVFLVEDAAAVRVATRQILERCGYHVLESPSAADALALAVKHREPVHLLLTDVVMPGMNGRALAEEFVKLHPEAKVLFMSGYTDDRGVRNDALHTGSAYLQKPFSSDTLTRKLREVLDRRCGRAAS